MVKRYAMAEYPHETYMEEYEGGDYVLYSDYASLLAQVKALEVYPGRCERLEIENSALRYQIKKLEKERIGK